MCLLGNMQISPITYEWNCWGKGVVKSRIRLSDFTFTFHFHALEKEMATHSSVLAWRIPGTGEPGGLPSMGSHRVRHDWSYLAATEDLLHFTRWLSVKYLPANSGDTGNVGQSLDQEDPLEKEMATQSSILAWKIQWTEEAGGLP